MSKWLGHIGQHGAVARARRERYVGLLEFNAPDNAPLSSMCSELSLVLSLDVDWSSIIGSFVHFGALSAAWDTLEEQSIFLHG